MIDPGSFVDAESSDVGSILTEMTRLVIDRDGALHPGLRMVERSGELTVFCSDHAGTATDQPLFDVPRELLIPVDGAAWVASDQMLVLAEPPPGLTALQRDALDLHIALYNATGKLPWAMSSHPRLALRGEPEAVAAIKQVRPGFDVAGTGQRASEAPAADVFLGTRVFGLPPAAAADKLERAADPAAAAAAVAATRAAAGPAGSSADGSPDSPRQRVLMTLIDLLNHHPRGASYRVDARAMTPAVARPTGTDECFAHYGHRRDTLDLALNYGYLDTATDFIHCVPLDLDVAGFGAVRVGGARRRPVNPLDPPQVTVDSELLSLSHITFQRARPDRWQTAVRMAVQATALQRGAPMGRAQVAADAVVSAIVEAQRDALVRVGEAAAAIAAGNAAAALIARAAEFQVVGLPG